MIANNFDNDSLKAAAKQIGALFKTSRTLNNVGNEQCRIFRYQKECQLDNSVQRSFELWTVADAPFDAISILLSASQNTGGTGMATCTVAGSVAVVSAWDATGVSADNATWVPLTWNGGQTTGTWGSSTAKYLSNNLKSDYVNISSLPRTDVVGALPIIIMRITIQTTGYLYTIGDQTTWLAPWRTHPTHPMLTRACAGDHASTLQTGFTSASGGITSTTTPFAGFKARLRKKVVNVMGCGDSITEGIAGTYNGEGAIGKALWALNANNGPLVYSWMCVGWQGSPSAQHSNFMNDIYSYFMAPDICFFPNDSPNNYGAGITASLQALAQQAFSNMWGLCHQYGVRGIGWTMLPVNRAARALGATDALRLSYNADVISRRQSGFYIQDPATLLVGNNGTPDGFGQQITNPAYMTDIHPNDAGYQLWAVNLIIPGVQAHIPVV